MVWLFMWYISDTDKDEIFKDAGQLFTQIPWKQIVVKSMKTSLEIILTYLYN